MSTTRALVPTYITIFENCYDYLIDTSVGVILTYGADAIAGGKGADKDVFVKYKGPLRPIRVQYEGSWGRPTKKNKIHVTFNKPLQVVDEKALMNSLSLLRNIRSKPDGQPVSLAKLNSDYGHQWQLCLEKSKAEDLGLLVFENHVNLGSVGQVFTPTMEMDLLHSRLGNLERSDADGLVNFGIKEKLIQHGPLDATIYGSEVKSFLSAPISAKVGSNGRRMGVKMERY